MLKFSLLKSNCLLCGFLVSGSVSLCAGCRADLPRVEFACQTCALPMEVQTEVKFCGQCVSQKPYVDYAVNIFHYENPIDYLISLMKFHYQLSAAAVLADLLKCHVENVLNNELDNSRLSYGLPDAILPIPLHQKRLAKRGFNQSLEICKSLAKSNNIPVLSGNIKRAKETQSQTNLNKQQRIKNVAACFELLEKPIYSHIVIVDDVVTTGSTTNELAKLLKSAGVKTVGVWSLARAELN